jgi:hypothetical protein
MFRFSATESSVTVWNASLALVAICGVKVVLDKGLRLRQALRDVS